MGTGRAVVQTAVRAQGLARTARCFALVFMSVVCVSISWSMLAVAPANGAITHEFLKQIKEVPETVAVPGSLSRVTELAIDAGELYVAEPFGPERVDAFNDTSGQFVLQFPLESAFAARGDLGLTVSTSTGATEVLLGADTTEEPCGMWSPKRPPPSAASRWPTTIGTTAMRWRHRNEGPSCSRRGI